MAQRRHHYERAFEDYLRTRRIPYVAVDEARKALLPAGAPLTVRDAADAPPTALKSFDFVIYGKGVNLLVEIKGRKLARRAARILPAPDGAGPARRAARPPGRARLESWVTRDDVESLGRWEALFGPEFAAVFVFIYWCDAQPPDALFQEVFERRGRWYALRAVRVTDYARHMKVRSLRWGTVDLATEAFERVSVPFAPSVPHPLAPGSDIGSRSAVPGPGTPALEVLGEDWPGR